MKATSSPFYLRLKRCKNPYILLGDNIDFYINDGFIYTNFYFLDIFNKVSEKEKNWTN